MMRHTLPLLAAWWLVTAASATMWSDPTFEGMVESAELVAVLEIIEGGAFAAKARAVQLLKGHAPGEPFPVGGYNNPWWPPDAVKKESLEKGERLLMFLHPRDRRKEEGEEGEGKVWATPTPSTGDYRIKDGKLHGGWFRVSYPHFAPGVDAELALGLLRGLVAHQEGREPAAARSLLAQHLTVAAARAVTDAEDATNRERAQTLTWLLCAQAAYGEPARAPAILAAARSSNVAVKRCAARALRSCANADDALAALGELLRSEDSFVQAEAARTLILGACPRERAVPLLVAALPGDTRWEGAASVMDPLQNTRASGREMIVRALTHLEAWDEAHDGLVELICDEGLNEGVFNALCSHFVKFPSVAARRKFIELYARCPEAALPLFHKYLLAERSPEALRAVADKIRDAEMSDWSREEALGEFAAAAPPGDPRLAALVVSLLRRHWGSEDAHAPVASCIAVASEKVELLLRDYPTGKMQKKEFLSLLDIARRAVALKRAPPGDPQKHVEAWLDLLGPERDLYYARPYLLRELVRITPASLRAYAARRLRELYGAAVRAYAGDALKSLEDPAPDGGREPQRPFLGVPDDRELRREGPEAGWTRTVTAVQAAGYEDYLALKRGRRIFAEEYRGDFIYYAVRSTVDIATQGSGTDRPARTCLHLTKRFKAVIPTEQRLEAR